MKHFLPLVILVLLLAFALTQSSSPPIILSALPAETTSPRLSVNADVQLRVIGGKPTRNRVRVTVEYYDEARKRWVQGTGFSASGVTLAKPVPPSISNRPTLLQAYWVRIPRAPQHPGDLDDQTSVRGMRYLPRGFTSGVNLELADLVGAEPDPARHRIADPGPYAGWDALVPNVNVSGTHKNRADDRYQFLRLSREARVCLLWFGAPAS